MTTYMHRGLILTIRQHEAARVNDVQAERDELAYERWVYATTGGRYGGVAGTATKAVVDGLLADLADKLDDAAGVREQLVQALRRCDNATVADLGAALGCWAGPDGEGR